jgi:hypothetical protein
MDAASLGTLRTELSGDPAGLGYQGLSDAQAADALNARTRPGKQPVPASEVRRYVLLNGLWPGLQNLAANGTDPVQKGTALTILQTLAPNSFDSIRMNDPAVAAAVTQMLQTMVDAGVMTAAHRDAMVALGDAQVSRAEELGLGHVHHIDVAEARSGNQ